MPRTRTSRPRPVLPLATALTLSTITFLSGCTSSAEIESDARAEAAAGSPAAQTLAVDTSPEQADRVSTDEDPAAAALVPDGIAEDGPTSHRPAPTLRSCGGAG